MKRMRLIALLLTLACLLCACSRDASDVPAESGSGTASGTPAAAGNLLTGIYTPTEITADFSLRSLYDLQMQGKTLVFRAYVANEDGSESRLCRLNTEDFSITSETLPEDEDGIEAMAVGKDEVLLLFRHFDPNTFEDSYRLCAVRNGEKRWERALDDLVELSDRLWDRPVIGVTADGVWMVGAGNTLATLNDDGTLKSTEMLPDSAAGIAPDTQGRLHVWGYTFHYVVNDKGKPAELDHWNDLSSVKLFFGKGYDCYYADETGINGFNAQDGSSTPLLNYINSDLMSDAKGYAAVSPDCFILYGSETMSRENGDYRLWRFDRVSDRVPDEQIIVRVTYMENGLKKVPMAAVNYNRSQNKYRVVCEEAGSDLDQLIISGQSGDLIMTNSRDSLHKYAEKGLFADLNTLFSGVFTADSLLGCAKEAGTVDGKLFGIPTELKLSSYAARHAQVGDGVWNLKAVLALNDSLSDGQQLMGRLSQPTVYVALRDGVLSECIDFDAGTCNFENDAFLAFLNLLAAMPAEDDGNYDANIWIDGKTALYEADISNIAVYSHAFSGAIFGDGEDVRMIGYPSASGGAAGLSVTDFFSIAKDSDVKEGAMDFLYYLLSPDSVVDEMRGMRGIPSLKASLEAYRELETQMDYIYYYDMPSRFSGQPHRPGESRDGAVIVPITDELFDEYVAYLDNLHILPYIPEVIRTILWEDVSAFLSGAKDASETARLLQNRIGTYLSEQQ